MLVDAEDPDAAEPVRVAQQHAPALGHDGVVGGVPRDGEALGDAGDGQVLADDRLRRPPQRSAGQPGPRLRGLAEVLTPDVPAAGAAVAADRHKQRRRAPAQRLVRERPNDAVVREAMAAAALAPRVGLGDAAREDRPLGLEVLAYDDEAELVEAAEGGQVRAVVGSVRQRRGPSGGSVRTPILEGPRPRSRQRRARPAYTVICEEPDNRADHVRWAFEAYATGDYSLNLLAAEVEARGLTQRETAKRTTRVLPACCPRTNCTTSCATATTSALSPGRGSSTKANTRLL